ncbi:hypothetical protein LR48_Vigan03g105400 [Vigna angularis]|uniref:Uncharacterized protein n=1 Tax=Phaseolus angularis TaxID=3914 RepID=A0A0L9U4S7_PHAAN|nr:hypothetical protein LR48_Vigan03g105400 [Vigna angularis]
MPYSPWTRQLLDAPPFFCLLSPGRGCCCAFIFLHAPPKKAAMDAHVSRSVLDAPLKLLLRPWAVVGLTGQCTPYIVGRVWSVLDKTDMAPKRPLLRGARALAARGPSCTNLTEAPTDGGGGAVAEYKLLLEEDVSDESEASLLHCWRCKESILIGFSV